MTLVLAALALVAQTASRTTIHGAVVDATGAAVAGAHVSATGGHAIASATTGGDGSWTIAVDAPPPIRVTISAPGFAGVTRTIDAPDAALRVELEPQAIAERVTVSGTAGHRLSMASSATVIDRQAIAAAPALAIDEQLRVVPGFSLFRRTSSLAANPTTQGVTLRGMSASGASRTLVLADGVPLNDPFGAWVYWDRVPSAALDSIDVSRGAASDVHGNDALGGVISMRSRTSPGVDVRVDAGGESTSRVSAYGGLERHGMLMGVAGESLRTDGYVVTAPESRGPIDTPAGVAARSTMGWFGAARGALAADARGGYFSEARGNGTPAQVNATIARWGSAGARGFAAGGAWEVRGDWTGTSYRQTFSAVATARTSERLTSLQWVAASSRGATLTWIASRGRGTALFSGSTRSWQADLQEVSISAGGAEAPVVVTPASERSDGLAAQAHFDVSSEWTVEAGARGEVFRSRLRTPGGSESVEYAINPRVALSWRPSPANTLRVSWLSGFRGPTMNELFRNFRVGSTLTLANASLAPEKAWGPEAAFTSQHDRWTARGIVYATRLSDAIYSRTLPSALPGAAITRQRSNADARAIGSEVELEWRAARRLALSSSWAFNDSRFTAGDLDGKRIPQVPRVQGTIGARLTASRATATIDIRVFGSQFDDDVNAFELRAGSVTAARAGWTMSRRLDVFAAVENAFDADVDTGRTPIRTVSAPRVARAGVRLRF